MYQKKTFTLYLISYLIAISTALRGLLQFHHQPEQSAITNLLVIFFALMITEPWLSRRSLLFTHIYLGLQTIVVATLLMIPPARPSADYFAVLYITLAMQAMHTFPSRTGFRWIGIFSVANVFLMIHKFSWGLGLPFAVQYPVIYIFVGAFLAANRHAETAREQSQKLLMELQIHTAKVEELVAVEERNRLARDLHDSVTQTIFSITLTAQAAQLLLEREPLPKDGLATQIKRLQEQSQGALVEMRSLIYQLRPTAVAEEGLIPALRKHIAGLERRKSMRVDLQANDDQLPLNTKQQQEIFHIIQEALNNVSKHAQTDSAHVTLKTDRENFTVLIEDHGSGFNLAEQTKNKFGIGLHSMRERVVGLGGVIDIASDPQTGTQIYVAVPIPKEQSTDG